MKGSTFIVGLLLALASPGVSIAQTQVQTQTQTQAPPRDARPPAQTGSAIVRGRISAAESDRPLRRARIRLTAPELGPEGRTTSTGVDGRYEIKDLPAGRYTIVVMRSGYLQLSYGQRRPLEQGRPLQIGDKQVIDHVDFALPKTSAITGRVIDELGEPVSDTTMFVMRQMWWQGRRRLTPAGIGDRTDDVGGYRITGLVPGTYFVMALLRDTWTVSENGVDRIFGYAPTYFPGTSNIANATRVIVGIGEESGGHDFALVPGRSATVSGTAVDSRGRPLAGRSVGLLQEFRGPAASMMMSSGTGQIGADGTFTIKNVVPGEYKMGVQTTTEGSTPGTTVPETAVMPIIVDSADITGMSLVTSAGWSASGRVTTEDGTAPKIPQARMTVTARLLDFDTAPNSAAFSSPDGGRPRDDWTFSVPGIVGPARLRATVPEGWALKAILQGERDVTDEVLDQKSGESLTGLEVVVTDRVTTVTGQVVGDKGAPVSDGTVMIFTGDAEKWGEQSRWIRTARPDQQGQYQIKGLPPGEYLAIAMEEVEDGIWNDPEYLTGLRASAQRVVLDQGGTKTLSLTLLKPAAR